MCNTNWSINLHIFFFILHLKLFNVGSSCAFRNFRVMSLRNSRSYLSKLEVLSLGTQVVPLGTRGLISWNSDLISWNSRSYLLELRSYLLELRSCLSEHKDVPLGTQVTPNEHSYQSSDISDSAKICIPC